MVPSTSQLCPRGTRDVRRLFTLYWPWSRTSRIFKPQYVAPGYLYRPSALPPCRHGHFPFPPANSPAYPELALRNRQYSRHPPSTIFITSAIDKHHKSTLFTGVESCEYMEFRYRVYTSRPHTSFSWAQVARTETITSLGFFWKHISIPPLSSHILSHPSSPYP